MKTLAALLFLGSTFVACSGPRDGALPDPDRTRQDPTLSLLDLLDREPGVDVDGQGRVHIRGSAQEPLILVDGVSVPSSRLSTIPVVEVERIRVLKGPEAAIYGVRAQGGAIEITTKRGA